MELPKPCLYVVTEPSCPKAGSAAGSHLLVAIEALEGGADAIQFRNKDAAGGKELPFQEALVVCNNIRRFCEARGKMFIVNDDLQLAKECGAHGVHLGQEDLAKTGVAQARQALGNEALVGISASRLEEALQAVADGADYVGYGPVFATESKNDAAKAAGLEGLKELRKEFDDDNVSIPIIAIGGISEENAKEVMAAGADGIAVISAISRADDPEKAARRLKQIISGEA